MALMLLYACMLRMMYRIKWGLVYHHLHFTIHVGLVEYLALSQNIIIVNVNMIGTITNTAKI